MRNLVTNTDMGKFVKSDSKSISHYEQSAINFADILLDMEKNDELDMRTAEVSIRKAIILATDWLEKAQVRSAARMALLQAVSSIGTALDLDEEELCGALENIWYNMRAGSLWPGAPKENWEKTGKELIRVFENSDDAYEKIGLMLTDIEVWVNLGVVESEVLETARITVLSICGQGECDERCNNCVFFPPTIE